LPLSTKHTSGFNTTANQPKTVKMAKHLARIHGTEEDKVNCPFYYKIGACRHSDRCSRLHHKPAFSPTLLIKVGIRLACYFEIPSIYRHIISLLRLCLCS